MRIQILKPLLVGCLIILFNVSCSSFDHKWEEAAVLETGKDAAVAGRWEGSWTSDVNGHTGTLRCILTPIEEGRVQADFHARFWKFFSWRYQVPLAVDSMNKTNRISGSSNLGWLFGGQYQCRGGVQDSEFTATYTNRYDHGIMVMSRPE